MRRRPEPSLPFTLRRARAARVVCTSHTLSAFASVPESVAPRAAVHARLAQHADEYRDGAERADQQKRPAERAARTPFEPVAYEERRARAEHAARAGDEAQLRHREASLFHVVTSVASGRVCTDFKVLELARRVCAICHSGP